MNIILRDMVNFDKKLEGISDNTVYFEIPTNNIIKNYTFTDTVFNWFRFKKTNTIINGYVLFEMDSVKGEINE
jgi:hypothetical protein